MESISVPEMMDYIKDMNLNGIELTPSGIGAAIIILNRRSDWTEAHAKMLGRLMNGETVLPHKLRRLVNDTRLGLAIELARKLCKGKIKNQKARARRKARRATAAVVAA